MIYFNLIQFFFFPALLEGQLARQCYEGMRRQFASLRIQTCFRMYHARKAYQDLSSASMMIQAGLRGMAARKELHFRQQTRAAIIIQVKQKIMNQYQYIHRNTMDFTAKTLP